MFSYISSFLSFFTGGSAIVQDDEGKSKKEDENKTVDAIDQIVYLEENKSFDGTITSYFNNVGLINDSIYFTHNCIIGHENPQVGDNVNVQATRSHSEGGWVATRVHIVHPWDINDSEDNKPVKESIIGTIINIKNLLVQVDTNVSQIDTTLKKFKSGYKPYRGDFVQIELWNKGKKKDIEIDNLNSINPDDIISVSPLREKKIHGVVTELCNGYGFINIDIYFQFSVCERGHKVKKGDNVIALVLESKQKRGEWRATNVILKNERKKSENSLQKSNTCFDKDVNIEISHGVSIKGTTDFGNVNFNELIKTNLFISNQGKEAVTFISLNFVGNNGDAIQCKLGPDLESYRDKSRNVKNRRSVEDIFLKGKMLCPSMILNPLDQKEVLVEFTPNILGKFATSIQFNFENFNIDILITANVIDRLGADVSSTAPYVKPQGTFFGKKVNTRFSDTTNVIPGQRPIQRRKFFLPNKLAKYPIPSYLNDLVLNCEGDIELAIPELAQPLHISNYRKKLSTLQHIEEIQMNIEMRQYDMAAVLLRPKREYLSLEVPGLAEGRPSLLLGDRVVVSYSNKSKKSPSYEGFIHEIHAEEILLKFKDEFHSAYGNDDMDVEFHFNRTPMRRAHQAIEHAIDLGEEVLFPNKIIPKSPLVDTTTSPLKLHNSQLNERQKEAVERILEARNRPIPYILFGPPGTGKSVTVVETILQVFGKIKHSRVLACAPSNSAADLLAERLHYSGIIKKHDMIRINAFQRSLLNQPECIEEYSTNDTDNLHMLLRHRIIITTCNMAGFLYSYNLKVGHFTHIFVDEAGQATEPECLIPIGFSVGCEDSQVVLAGDPYQLGSVLRSDIAEEFGLGLSLLERLSNSNLYERDELKFSHCGYYNPLVVTKLINNYRSHAKLLALSSSIFYNRELIPCADQNIIDMFVGSSILKNKNIPFIFHGLRSEDLREGNSPSWFNPMEAVQVIRYVQIILRLFENRITIDDIGIITPYRKQVEKIRALLERFDLDDIKVGSVEEFQGQERQCIILSTVRSTETMVDFDCYHNIGFLSNPKRFNVSITRAQALLIVIGNPVVLCYDPYWCAMLQYAVMNDCYVGSDLPKLNSEVVQENFKKALQLLQCNTTIGNINEHIDEEEEEPDDGDSVEIEEEHCLISNDMPTDSMVSHSVLDSYRFEKSDSIFCNEDNHASSELKIIDDEKFASDENEHVESKTNEFVSNHLKLLPNKKNALLDALEAKT